MFSLTMPRIAGLLRLRRGRALWVQNTTLSDAGCQLFFMQATTYLFHPNPIVVIAFQGRIFPLDGVECAIVDTLHGSINVGGCRGASLLRGDGRKCRHRCQQERCGENQFHGRLSGLCGMDLLVERVVVADTAFFPVVGHHRVQVPGLLVWSTKNLHVSHYRVRSRSKRNEPDHINITHHHVPPPYCWPRCTSIWLCCGRSTLSHQQQACTQNYTRQYLDEQTMELPATTSLGIEHFSSDAARHSPHILGRCHS